MARYGARNAKWAPFAAEKPDEDAAKLPTYGEAKTFGQLNKVTDNLNFNEGSMFGDDAIVLYEKKFKDGTMDAESVYIPVADAAVMLGAKADAENGLSHSADDNPPYIAYGFTTHHVSKDKAYFQAVFYSKLKASPSSETYETRGDNINFATDKLSFHIETPLCRIYKIVKDFASEAEATAYIDNLFKGAAVVPGLTAASDT